MNTFNKKSLYAAIAGVSALGMAGTADAVHVNPDGLGQVLIYPYYTTRTRAGTIFSNPQYNSLLSVVNSTASAKAVKVRFLEGKASKEVLDFNLYLSAKDVWTAGILPTADGAGIVTFDKSCTVPSVSSNPASPTPFVNFVYASTDPDTADSSLDRTREGYVEIIEMGDVTGPTAVAATHVAGVPPCKASDLTAPVAPTNTLLGSGGLFGTMTIINVNASAETAYDAVALEAFRTAGGPLGIWASAGSINPDLRDQLDASPTTHQAETYAAGAVVFSGWLTAINAVSASLMHDNVMNEYILDTGTASLTDWVLTYPTKRYYVSSGTGAASGGLFQRNFNGKVGSCDDVGINFWDREENSPSGPPPGFSPPPPGSPVAALCWEANIVTWNNSNLFASTNSANINTSYPNGWGTLNLVGGATSPTHRLISVTNQTFNGLPVVGFMTATYYNGKIPLATPAGATIQSAYAGSFKHKTTTLIQ
jgi:hypothetical protein